MSVPSPGPPTYDLEFVNSAGTRIGVMLDREAMQAARIAGRRGAAQEGQELRHRSVPITLGNFQGGMGFTKAAVRDGYSHTIRGCTRSPMAFLPAGEVTEMPVPPDTGRIYDSEMFNSPTGTGDQDIILAATRRVLRIPHGTEPPTILAQGDANFIATSTQRFGGGLYIGSPSGGGGLLHWGGTAPENAPSVNRKYLAAVYQVVEGTGQFVLVGTTPGERAFRYTSANPLIDANWKPATEIPVGNTAYPIVGLLASNRAVLFLKTNGVHFVDSRGYSPNLTPWMESNDPYNIENCNTSLLLGGWAYIAHSQGLFRMRFGDDTRQDDAEWCHPGAGTGHANETPIRGIPTAMCVESGWLAVAFWDPNDNHSYLCFGKDRASLGIPGPGPMIWHGSEWDTNGRITHMRAYTPSDRTKPGYLLMAVNPDTGPAKIYRMSLPRSGSALQDLIEGGPHRFAMYFSMYTSDLDWDDPEARKFVRRFGTVADRLGAGSLFNVYVGADGNTPQHQGAAVNSPHDDFDPTDQVNGYVLQARIDGVAKNNSDVPVLRALKAEAGLLVRQQRVQRYPVLFGVGCPLRNHATDERDPETVWSDIVALEDEDELTMVNQFGQEELVKVEQGDQDEIIEASNGAWVRRAWLTVTHVTAAGIMYADVGHEADSGKVAG